MFARHRTRAKAGPHWARGRITSQIRRGFTILLDLKVSETRLLPLYADELPTVPAMAMLLHEFKRSLAVAAPGRLLRSSLHM